MERVYTTPLLDKLGIRPGMRVALIDIDDPEIRAAHRRADDRPDRGLARARHATSSCSAPIRSRRSTPLATLATRIRPNGAIWVVSRKGKAATLRDVEVIDAAKAAGLVDNKVASFSATHTALRLVIPVAAADATSSAADASDRSALARPARAVPSAHGPDLLILLVIILVLVVLWRGPKTLPKLGEALGRGVKEAKTEATKAQAEIQARHRRDGRRPTPDGDRPA